MDFREADERELVGDGALQRLWVRMLQLSWAPEEWFEDGDPPRQDD